MSKATYQSIKNKLEDDVKSYSRERAVARSMDAVLVSRPLSYYRDKYIKECRASGPDRKDLRGSLRKFWKKAKLSCPNYVPKLFNASEEELQRRMRHADACLEAMSDACMEEAKYAGQMVDTIDSLFGAKGSARKLFGEKWSLSNLTEEEKENPDAVLQGLRGLKELLDLRDTPEARENNERVVMLMALNERKISEADYRTMRESQLKARHPQTYQKMIKDELEHSFDELFKMMQTHVETKQAKYHSADMKKHRECIVDMNETDPQKLREAYKVVFSGTSEIAMNGKWIAGKLEGVYKDRNGRPIQPTEQQKSLLRQYESDEIDYRSEITPLSAMANPYTAILDQHELVDFIMPTLATYEHEAKNEIDALFDFTVDTGEMFMLIRGTEDRQQSIEAQLKEVLERTGMQDAVKKDTKHPETHVYEKDGQKLILRNEYDVFNNPHIRADVPGKLINYDLNARLSELDEICIERDQGWGSKAYTEMRNALHVLKDAKLSDNPTTAELNALQKKLEDMQKKVDAYMERKRRQRVAKGDHEVIGGKPYEQKRISFARELGAFTQDKLAAIETIRNHQAVMQRGLGEINADLNQPAPAMRESRPAEDHPRLTLTNINELLKEQNAEKAEEHPKLKKSLTIKKESEVRLNIAPKTEEKIAPQMQKKHG